LPDSDVAFLELAGIAKRYGGVRALEGVDFACRKGSIHAVLGENGAGKSTLIKIISGVVQPDAGTMRLEGREVAFAGPAAANAAGIVCIFQELSLVPDLSVADNISISDPPRRLGLIDRRAQRRRAERLLARLGCEDVNPLARVRDLPLSRRQMVEIAKALGKDPRVLILDEATSALTAADVELVYAILKDLRRDGLSILYISHRMHEIDALADTCSVFRNGRHIETFAKGAARRDEIVQLMIGREIEQVYPPKPAPVAAARPCSRSSASAGTSGCGRSRSRRPRRDRGPGRPRRPGPARPAAGAVRRALRRHRHGPAGRRETGPPARRRRRRPACGWR
jgi:ribose transport system ATP-binding protein